VIADRPEDWADALLDLWADASKRQRLGAAAREWVSVGHSWPSAADRALRGLASADRVVASRR
jgi:hypothetical protein